MASARLPEVAFKPITPAQIKAIHVALSRLGIDDETYRATLWRMFNVATCKALSRRQASTLLKRLGKPMPKAKKPHTRPHRRPVAPVVAAGDADKVVVLATAAQRHLIAALVSEVPWRKVDGYQTWLAANMGLKRVVTRAEAGRVIEGLKAMKRKPHHADGQP